MRYDVLLLRRAKHQGDQVYAEDDTYLANINIEGSVTDAVEAAIQEALAADLENFVEDFAEDYTEDDFKPSRENYVVLMVTDGPINIALWGWQVPQRSWHP